MNEVILADCVRDLVRNFRIGENKSVCFREKVFEETYCWA